MKLKQKVAIRYIRTKFKILSSISKKKAAEKAFDLFCTPQTKNLKKPPIIFSEGEKLSFRFQQFTIHGYRWNKGAGRRILVLHGFESSVVNFDKYISNLIKKDYEVLAFDAPAHGKSSGRKLNALIYRDFIKHIYSEYGPVQSFLGHSFGGLAICMALAEIKHDDNIRVVLIAPATETNTAIDLFFQFIQLNDAAVRKELEEIISRMSGYPVSWYSIFRTLRKISAKILWLHDEDDKTTPLKDVLRIKEENYSNIQFIITKGLGHRRIYKDTSVNKAAVDFL